ncbi:MAG: hypothetical protein AAFV72_09080 [Cyanobacteria bacterium J06635_1]
MHTNSAVKTPFLTSQRKFNRLSIPSVALQPGARPVDQLQFGQASDLSVMVSRPGLWEAIANSQGEVKRYA